MTGFEPATTWSQPRCATGLRYAPNGFAKLIKIPKETKFFLRADAPCRNKPGWSGMAKPLIGEWGEIDLAGIAGQVFLLA